MRHYEILTCVMFGCFLAALLFCVIAIIHGMLHGVKSGRKELRENKDLFERQKAIKEAEAILPVIPQPEPPPKPMLAFDPSAFQRITIDHESQRWTTEIIADHALSRVLSAYLTKADSGYVLKDN